MTISTTLGFVCADALAADSSNIREQVANGRVIAFSGPVKPDATFEFRSG
jgi:hypothetical protein